METDLAGIAAGGLDVGHGPDPDGPEQFLDGLGFGGEDDRGRWSARCRRT